MSPRQTSRYNVFMTKKSTVWGSDWCRHGERKWWWCRECVDRETCTTPVTRTYRIIVIDERGCILGGESVPLAELVALGV